MAAFETSYPNLLQGVSQQIPRDRLPGQVQAQTNMLSDAVTGIRRRPGAEYRFNLPLTGATVDNIKAWHTDIAGERVHVILNCSDGSVKVLDDSYTVLSTLAGGSYLTTSTPGNIKAATVGDELFIVNTDKNPVYGTLDGGLTPDEQGCFYVQAGAFSKEYSVQIKSELGTATLAYVTPDGTTAGDAALATPAYIAEQLYDQLALLDGFDVDAGALQVKTLVQAANTEMLKIIAATTYAGQTGREVQDAIELIQPDLAPILVNLDDLMAAYPADLVTAQAEANAVHAALLTVQADLNLVPSGSKLADSVKSAKESIKSAVSLAFTVKTAVPSAGTLNWLTLYRQGAFVYAQSLLGTGPLSVSSNTGVAYLVASKDSYFTSAGLLPQQLPDQADGYIVRVGDITLPQYFKYNADRQVWLESGKFASPLTLENMPVAVTQDTGSWTLASGSYEGRFAGDELSNPDFNFILSGITGIGSYQGRLVLLSGPLVCMSASGKPRRFFRSTVTELLDSDPIEVGSSANSSAAYRYAVPFMKDLLLFSDRYQALVPYLNTALTPRNANVVPTSAHAADMTSSPLVVGRTLMYPAPRSENFFGLLEMVPSQSTEAQYVSVDATQHLPKYMGGRCRFSASSGVSGIAVFAPSGDKRTLLVHEYLWDNDTKQQQAWHQWTFPYDIAATYFVQEILHVLFVQNELVVGCAIDPRVGLLNSDASSRPFLDLYVHTTIVDNVVTPPAWMLTFDPGILDSAGLALTTGDMAGEAVGFTVGVGVLATVLSHPSGDVALGIPYRSSLVPTRPIVRDFKDIPISTHKHTVQRFIVGTANSMEYIAAVSDRFNAQDPYSVGTLLWSSPELQLDHTRAADESYAVVPARTNASSTVLELYTEGTGELNIVSIEHVDKFHQKVKRR